jgi:asparagine synthase (glutamine-hydrolysing)
LSGGIDSSLVVALARQLHQGELYTYSVSFGSAYKNELPFSSLVAEHCGTHHRIVELSPEAILQNLDRSIGALGDPIGDPLTVPNLLLFQQAARDVDVVLNGEGGDPCFGGPKNLPMVLADLFGDGSEDGSDVNRRERSYLRAHQKCFDDLSRMLSTDVRTSTSGAVLEREVTPFFTDERWENYIEDLLAGRVAGLHPRRGVKIWMLVTLESWLRSVFSGAAST